MSKDPVWPNLAFRLCLAIPLGLLGAGLLGFAILVKQIGIIFFMIALVYFILCAGVMITKNLALFVFWAVLGLIGIIIVLRISMMTAPW